jgi:hypothetical protein
MGSLHDSTQDIPKGLGMEGFLDIAFNPDSVCFLEPLLTAFGGDQDDRDMAILLFLLEFSHHLESVHDRHIEIGQNQIDAMKTEQFQGLLAVSGFPAIA